MPCDIIYNMDRVLEYKIEKDCILRDLLRRKYSGRRIHFLREKGCLLLNGQNVNVSAMAKKGDVLTMTFKETETFDYLPIDMGLKIIYEDEDVLVVFKPSGVASMPVAPHFSANLFNGLKFLFPDGVFRVVTRLDKDTSGIVLIAKNALSHSILHSEIRSIEKTYTAIVEGVVKAPITISAPICSTDGAKRMVGEGGKPSITHIIDARQIDCAHSFVTIKTETGRTHQIRVHLAYIGYPLVGDSLYGNGGNGHILCCSGIVFTHPISRKKMSFEVDGTANLGTFLQISQ